MDNYNEDALQAAVAPGIAKAQAIFDQVANDMAGHSASEIHDEPVKQLEAAPFEWDDKGLQEIANSISKATAESTAKDETGSDEDDAPTDSTSE
jgi:hypothetical protein